MAASGQLPMGYLVRCERCYGDLRGRTSETGKSGIGALIGVPFGILFGQFIPHDMFAYDLTVLLSILTLVAFRRYVLGFALRCALIAMAFVVAGSTIGVAAERVMNVLMGGLAGYVFVLAVNGVNQFRSSYSKKV
jgi:hypothetical protein